MVFRSSFLHVFSTNKNRGTFQFSQVTSVYLGKEGIDYFILFQKMKM